MRNPGKKVPGQKEGMHVLFNCNREAFTPPWPTGHTDPLIDKLKPEAVYILEGE